jgi:hypothetical protein
MLAWFLLPSKLFAINNKTNLASCQGAFANKIRFFMPDNKKFMESTLKQAG